MLPDQPPAAMSLSQRPGYPDHLIAVQARGHLSVEPVQPVGRFVAPDGFVLFVTREENHATALVQSGLPDTPGMVVGFYTAEEPRHGEGRAFVSISAWASGGNRVAPDPHTLRAAQQAFLRSGYGDVSRALRLR